MTQSQPVKSAVEHVVVGPDQAGRRIDNYLTGYLRDVPRTRIYRMLRKGEVRVNGARIKQDYRVMAQDTIRIPPIFREQVEITGRKPAPGLLGSVAGSLIYEDDFLLVLNKPAGIAVHAGSGEHFGIIEILRELRPDDKNLELVHRLDKPTSGCLLIARNHRVLRDLHRLLRQPGGIKKQYLALLKGNLTATRQVAVPLSKNELRSGERMVQADESGKAAKTVFHPEQKFKGATLARIDIATGRTHQIRVHAASIGHPVAGDDKYGDREFNRCLKQVGLKRMFLHAAALTLKLPYTGKTRIFKAPLPDELLKLLKKL